MGQQISSELSKIQQPLYCCAPCNVDSKGRGDVEDLRKVQATDEIFPLQKGHGENGNDLPTPTKPFTFRNMTRQDYFSLYDAIHTLVRQEEISKEQENTLYDLIGRQDKRLASAYQLYKEAGDPTVLLDALKDRVSGGYDSLSRSLGHRNGL
uniref:Uncharacterized protein n=1 Tax=Cryptomonas curvata TaxID=233186 RepID=A0A7S0QBY6_9CRYP|mmetsp:Transcript_10606/g.22715  ORF Transcript_10606/g.22715 Transcript_10606/m.22715 type:complete len:152 (+) Transcript_10606:79-534(+)